MSDLWIFFLGLLLKKAVLSQLDIKWQQNFIYFSLITSKKVRWEIRWLIRKEGSDERENRKMNQFQGQLGRKVNSPWDQLVVEIWRTMRSWQWPWLFLLKCQVWEKMVLIDIGTHESSIILILFSLLTSTNSNFMSIYHMLYPNHIDRAITYMYIY